MLAASADRLSASLEDYLETIYELVRDQKVARVRDIARARGVRAASVTPAMRRLVELCLIRYEKREYIDLTPEGQREAQRVFSRHQVLKRFFEQVLGMPGRSALADACAMEHSLSPEGMDHMVRFFEFLDRSSEGQLFLDRFHRESLRNGEPGPRRERRARRASGLKGTAKRSVSLASLATGSRARVVRVVRVGAMRDRLLDMGLIPDVVVDVVRSASAGRMDVRVNGFGLRLSAGEARAVRVVSAGECR
ncbi:MAG: DtxR family transcriptional regulator [Vicinamibacterales bacterium]